MQSAILEGKRPFCVSMQRGKNQFLSQEATTVLRIDVAVSCDFLCSAVYLGLGLNVPFYCLTSYHWWWMYLIITHTSIINHTDRKSTEMNTWLLVQAFGCGINVKSCTGLLAPPPLLKCFHCLPLLRWHHSTLWFTVCGWPQTADSKR